MAKVFQRVWRAGPRKVKRAAWGYTVQIDGKQQRRFREEWTREDAEKALAARQLGLTPAPATPAPAGHAFAEAVERYLATKEAEGKRSIRDDHVNLARLKVALGSDTPLSDITADRVSAYKTQRLAAPKQRGEEGQRIAPATLNRELASLRHLLRLSAEEWGWLDKAPVIRLAKEPQGRLRFLTEDEIARLLNACDKPQSPYLHAIVTVAINTGMRKAEILGLTWERVDFSRGVILLERTKSGKRREVPMNTATDAALHAFPGEKTEGHVFRKKTGPVWGNIRTAFERSVRDAKLDDCRFHDLRHTFASHFMMRGGNLSELRDLLGHADIKMTTRYAHLSPAHLRAAVDKLEGLTPAKAAKISTRSAHEVESEPLSPVNPRNAGVAQRQSN